LISTVILDLDGPILEGRERHYTVYAAILREHGFEPMSPDRYWEMKRSRDDRRKQLAASGAGAIYEVFYTKWMERIEAPEMLLLDRVQPGVRETLTSWRARGLKLVLATMRQSPERLDAQLHALGVRDLLDEVVACAVDRGMHSKVERVRSLGLEPSTSVWIGDTELDIGAAREFGCPVCAVTCGLRTEDYLRSLGPDLVARETRAPEIEAWISALSSS
jgi:phosphoglycolate phosphatase-like HAD superfamily hydrolase